MSETRLATDQFEKQGSAGNEDNLTRDNLDHMKHLMGIFTNSALGEVPLANTESTVVLRYGHVLSQGIGINTVRLRYLQQNGHGSCLGCLIALG